MINRNSIAPPFQFTSHPPERGRVGNIEPACAGASCSSCCCCLHTLGGLVGALVFSLQESASRRRKSQEELDFQENITEGEGSSHSPPAPVPSDGMSVNAIYWRTLLVLSITWLYFGSVIMFESKRAPNVPEAMLVTGLYELLFYPGIQLLAGFVTIFVLAFNGRGGNPGNEFRQIARINLGILLGSVAGFLFMVFNYLLFK